MAETRSLRDVLRVKAGSRVRLADIDPRETFGRDKDASKDELAAGIERLAGLQERLYAEGKQALLVVLQGIDAAGKDGTIRHVMAGFNPMGCRVVSFKVPTADEVAHDFLWRVHREVPGHGEIAVFNRSHYEDVLVVRVHDLVPKDVWSRRYEEINAFEALLAANGIRIVKIFLLISRDEQRERFQERLDDPTKRWKFRMGDLDERKLWDDYIAAFDDALTRCSTDVAPWYVIPADRNWFRNLAVAEIVAETLEEMDPQYPPADPTLPADLKVE
jgi:PPK2 family polyphosphate:nucleotide phosphotransferase